VCIEAAAAAWKVGRRPEAVSALAAGLRRPDPAVRIKSGAYLSEIGADAGPATADLVEALDDPTPAVRDWAAAALKNLGRRAHPDLAAGLRYGGRERRRLALYALTGTGAAPETAAAVRAALEEGDGEVRVRAVRLLAELEPARRRELPPLLLPALRDPATAESAVDLLLELGPDARAVLPELQAMLSDPDPRTALFAAAALATAAPERAGEGLPVICSALYSGNPTLRPAALDVVMRLGPAARETRHAVLASLAPKVLGKEPEDWDLDLEALIQIGADDDALPLLIQALHGDNNEAARNAMFCLQRLGKKAGPSLRGVLENGRPAAVQRAQSVLRRINLQNKW
jgi:HEAT repeat protein